MNIRDKLISLLKRDNSKDKLPLPPMPKEELENLSEDEQAAYIMQHWHLSKIHRERNTDSERWRPL